MICLVGQPWAGLVQFSSSLCLLPGLCKDLVGSFWVRNLGAVLPGQTWDQSSPAWLLLSPLSNETAIGFTC